MAPNTRATSNRASTVSIANTDWAPAATRDLHRAQTDRTEPEHRDAVARSHAALVDA